MTSIPPAAHPELTSYLSNDVTFPTAYLRAVAAIASSDGVLNIADFNALTDVAALLHDSALARVVLLEFIDRPMSWGDALIDLQAASAGIDAATAAAAFEAARALLVLQGVRAATWPEAWPARWVTRSARTNSTPSPPTSKPCGTK
jgi:hypothetical protein